MIWQRLYALLNTLYATLSIILYQLSIINTFAAIKKQAASPLLMI